MKYTVIFYEPKKHGGDFRDEFKAAAHLFNESKKQGWKAGGVYEAPVAWEQEPTVRLTGGLLYFARDEDETPHEARGQDIYPVED